MIKISVVLPVYNDEKYLEESLESLINQTLKGIEIICVNDGSTDISRDIMRKYEEKFCNIRVINQENKGLSAARNRGLESSKGKYIYFIDSDDKLKRNALELVWKMCELKNTDVLFFSFENFCDDSELSTKYGRHLNSVKRTTKLEEVLTGCDILKHFWENDEYYVNVWIQIARRQFLLDNTIRFYEGIIYEDNIYTFLVLMKAQRVFCINEILYEKRIRANSIVTRKQNADSVRGYLITLLEMLDYLKEMEKISDSLRECIKGILSSISNKLTKLYLELDAPERMKFIQQCTVFERIFFEITFREIL